MTPEKQAADLVRLATGQDRNEAMTHKPELGTKAFLETLRTPSMADLNTPRTPAPAGEVAQTNVGNWRADEIDDAKKRIEMQPASRFRALLFDAIDALRYWPALSSRCAALEGENEAAVRWIGVVGEEFVNAGFPSGDRIVTLASVRDALKRLAASEAALAEARQEALEEAARECLLIDRDEAEKCPSGQPWVWYGRSRDHAAARIRALAVKP